MALNQIHKSYKENVISAADLQQEQYHIQHALSNIGFASNEHLEHKKPKRPQSSSIVSVFNQQTKKPKVKEVPKKPVEPSIMYSVETHK